MLHLAVSFIEVISYEYSSMIKVNNFLIKYKTSYPFKYLVLAMCIAIAMPAIEQCLKIKELAIFEEKKALVIREKANNCTDIVPLAVNNALI